MPDLHDGDTEAGLDRALEQVSRAEEKTERAKVAGVSGMITVIEKGDPDHYHDARLIDDYTVECSCGKKSRGENKVVIIRGRDENDSKILIVESSDDEQAERLKEYRLP